jgi:hypothetical protein
MIVTILANTSAYTMHCIIHFIQVVTSVTLYIKTKFSNSPRVTKLWSGQRDLNSGSEPILFTMCYMYKYSDHSEVNSQ